MAITAVSDYGVLYLRLDDGRDDGEYACSGEHVDVRAYLLDRPDCAGRDKCLAPLEPPECALPGIKSPGHASLERCIRPWIDVRCAVVEKSLVLQLPSQHLGKISGHVSELYGL